jgi:hypothetical protein
MGWFLDALDISRREGLAAAGSLPEAVTGPLAQRPALVIGRGAATVALGPGSHTFDHDAPPAATNWHLVGFRMPFEDGQFDTVVSVDMWRFLLPDDLGGALIEALRVAPTVQLVATTTAPDPVAVLPVPFAGDIDFIADILAAQLEVTRDTYGDVTVLTVRRRG